MSRAVVFNLCVCVVGDFENLLIKATTFSPEKYSYNLRFTNFLLYPWHLGENPYDFFLFFGLLPYQ